MKPDIEPYRNWDGWTVGDAELEASLARLQPLTSDQGNGLFGPQSMMWHVGRESVAFIAAGRAALMQNAHPWVATAIDQHSATKQDPVGRFRRTFTTVFAMIYGNFDQAMGCARTLHRIHKSINGVLNSTCGPFEKGSPYCANHLDALMWIHATLWDSAIVAYEAVLGPLSPAQKEEYYNDTRLFAALFGLPEEILPENWSAFTKYVDDMAHSEILSVGDEALDIGHFVLNARIELLPGIRLPIPGWYRATTAGLLPKPICEKYRLTFGPRDKKIAEKVFARTKRLYPYLPASVRFIPPYLEACAYIDGKKAPNIAVRRLSKVWLGQSSLLS